MYYVISYGGCIMRRCFILISKTSACGKHELIGCDVYEYITLLPILQTFPFTMLYMYKWINSFVAGVISKTPSVCRLILICKWKIDFSCLHIIQTIYPWRNLFVIYNNFMLIKRYLGDKLWQEINHL